MPGAPRVTRPGSSYRPAMTSPLTMSKSDREEFLADLHVGVLAVADDAGGPPLSMPVWYRYEPGGDVMINTGANSVKTRLLAAAGRATLVAQREELPYAFVAVDGPVSVTPADAAEHERIATRYLGDLAPAYLESTKDAPSVIVRLTPERWRTQDYSQITLA
jgi:nitroimidazol reductase NimA-like FMN-containing flavoprotein (pyridoxamine 5'-phosphate oxidase superfamily)